MLLMIDNYDSFTYNLVQYLGELGQHVAVYRNDQITLNDIEALAPSHIVISPGPCTPNEAGISVELAKVYGGEIPILGVCLGHQSIAQAFGGRVIRAQILKKRRKNGSCMSGFSRIVRRACSRACRVPSRRRAITHWLLSVPACRSASRSPQQRKTERSWPFAIKDILWSAFNFIQNRFSPSMAIACSITSSIRFDWR